MKKRFKIEYYDADEDDVVTCFKEFEDTMAMSAELQAEDYAYSMAEKGWHKVTELTQCEK